MDSISGARQRIPETDWIAIIRAVAGGDSIAFGNLYTMTHGVVFTLIVRVTGSKEVAEDLTIDVFHDVWRLARACECAKAGGTRHTHPYPPHTHADVEELHLLDGELWINASKLQAGDYHRAEAGTSDYRVWSETGCTCVSITSPGDLLR